MSNKNGYFREFGKFRLDAERRVLWFEDEPVDLPLKEVELLCVLTENAGQVATRSELLNRVWADSFVDENNLSRHIYLIRKTLKMLDKSADFIKTVPRRGYRFVGEIKSRGGDVVIERRSISVTMIEELENSVEPNTESLKAFHSPKRPLSRKVAAGVTAAVILAVVTGMYFYTRIAVAGDKPVKSVAVLPLSPIGNVDDESLGFGFADSIISSIGRLNSVEVRSVNSVADFSNEMREPRAIGKMLSVDAVVDGTIQRHNGELRVSLRLISTTDGKQIWSKSFVRGEREVFALQDLAAAETSKALGFKLTPDGRRGTNNVEAYQFYIQGLHIFRRRGTNNLDAAPLFRKAIELDPKFAKAWAGLAGVYAMGVSMAEAEKTIDKALELDPELADAHAVRGFIRMFLYWDWREAEKSLERAVAIDPNSVEAHHWRGILYQIRGDFDAAKAELKRALELDPTSANMTSDLGHVHYFAGEFDEAEGLFKTAESMEINIATNRLMLLYEQQNRDADALGARIMFYCSRLSRDEKSRCESNLSRAFDEGGTKGIARFTIEFNEEAAKTSSLPSDISYGQAISYLRIGNKQKAIESLRRSADEHQQFGTMTFAFPFLKYEPNFAELRNEPGFQQILRRLNL